MRAAKRLGLALLLLGGGMLVASAQDAPAEWQAVPADRAGLVFVFDERLQIESLTVSGKDADLIDSLKWGVGGAPLVKQYRLRPDRYFVRFAKGTGAPVEGFAVVLVAGVLTFVEIAPYRPQPEINGITFTTWTGKATPAIEQAVLKFGVEFADVIQPKTIDPSSNIIELNTTPPWPIPPPPKP